MKTKKKLKQKKAITLVALVITIIVLIILAGITITQLNNNGLLKNTNLARGKYINSQKVENVIIDEYSNQINNYQIAGNGRYGVNTMNNYSLDEQIIGTWIDGNTIYKKTIVVTTINNTDFIFDAKEKIDKNIDKVLATYGLGIVDDGTTYTNLPCYYNNSAYLGCFTKSQTKEVHIRSGSQYASGTYYLTFEYTKTTDTK